MFSARNAGQLRGALDGVGKARDALSVLLSQLEDEDEDTPSSRTLKSAVTAAKKAAGEAIDAADVDVGGGTRVDIMESVPTQVAERAVSNDGHSLVKLIDKGWGTTGYYSEDVLRDSGPAAFPKGTHMYWDHPTESEAQERPERSLSDLAAVFTEDAGWRENGPDGPGLYASVEVKKAYRGAVDDLAKDIGASIRSAAWADDGTAEGREGRLIERFIPHKTNSVDFVTLPGRGGSITQLFESSRQRNTEGQPVPGTPTPEQLQEQLTVRTTERDTLQKDRDEQHTRADRAEGALAVLATRDIATEATRELDLDDVAKEAARLRIIERAKPVMKDGTLDRDATKVAIEKDAADEVAYIARATGKGKVTGMGAGGTAATESGGAVDNADASKELQGYFQRLGLSESAAKVAAEGRSH